MTFSVIPTYGQGYKGLKNIDSLATKLETDGQDHPVILIKDENFGTQWNAKNEDLYRMQLNALLQYPLCYSCKMI